MDEEVTQVFEEKKAQWREHLRPLFDEVYAKLPPEVRRRKVLQVASMGSGNSEEIWALLDLCKTHKITLRYLGADLKDDAQQLRQNYFSDNKNLIFVTQDIDDEEGMSRILSEHNFQPDVVLIRHPTINKINLKLVLSSIIEPTRKYMHALQHAVAKISDGAMVVGTFYNMDEQYAFKDLMSKVNVEGDKPFYLVNSYGSKHQKALSPFSNCPTDRHYLIIRKFHYKPLAVEEKPPVKSAEEKKKEARLAQQRPKGAPRTQQPYTPLPPKVKSKKNPEETTPNATYLSKCGLFAVGVTIAVVTTTAVLLNNALNPTAPST